MTVQVESVEAWERDAQELLRGHWEELGLDLDLPLDPDIEKMKVLESLGMWKVLTVRDDGKMVGYLLGLFSTHLHYKSSPKMFIVDAYYICPEARRGAGVKMLKFMESKAKELGAIKIYLTCKVHRDHSQLFLALGYRLSDYAFTKRI